MQVEVLTAFGARGGEVEELLDYNENLFDLSALTPGTVLPLADEPFVDCWRAYADAAGEDGILAHLRSRLPQLQFPIREGISGSKSYRAATRSGAPTWLMSEATGLELEHPEAIELDIHLSPAGHIPVLIIRHREDFVSLVRAFIMKSEPSVVPDSMGAVMLAGFNNWDRVRSLRAAWEALPPDQRQSDTWSQELARITPQKELYQDRFILLSDGPYSSVPAADMGLDEGEWRQLSLSIRRDHECAHYLTRRLFGSMRNNLLDELIADYAGIVAAGRYRADWFLRFVGLESFPDYRDGARLDNYRGDPPLSDGATRVLRALVKAAAENLERFDTETRAGSRAGEPTLEDRTAMLTALASLRMEDLASEGAGLALRSALAEVRSRMDG